jgi:Domain of unknown function (DUF4373)
MKDAYYFQHDANARHDPKLLMLKKEFGMEGIGRWWCLVEILREQEDYAFDISQNHNRKALKHELDFESDEDLTAFLNELVELCLIRQFDGKIISHALMKRMNRLDEIKEKRREAGAKGGLARATKQIEASANQNQANANQMLQNLKHIPTYSSSESRSDSLIKATTDKQTHPATKSVQYAEAVPQAGMYAQHAPTASKDNSHLREPDTDNVYIYPSAYSELPVGAYFVPSDAKANTQQVLLKLSNDEAMTVKEKRTVRVLEQEHIVYSHLDYSQVSTIIQ